MEAPESQTPGRRWWASQAGVLPGGWGRRVPRGWKAGPYQAVHLTHRYHDGDGTAVRSPHWERSTSVRSAGGGWETSRGHGRAHARRCLGGGWDRRFRRERTTPHPCPSCTSGLLVVLPRGIPNNHPIPGRDATTTATYRTQGLGSRPVSSTVLRERAVRLRGSRPTAKWANGTLG